MSDKQIIEGDEMKPNFTYADVVYFVATLAATVTLATHVGQWKRYNNEELKAAAPHTITLASTIGADQRLTYSPSRYAAFTDRDAFSAGYSQANTRVASAVDGN